MQLILIFINYFFIIVFLTISISNRILFTSFSFFTHTLSLIIISKFKSIFAIFISTATAYAAFVILGEDLISFEKV